MNIRLLECIHCHGRSQARLRKEEGWRLVPTGCKNPHANFKSIMNSTTSENRDNARASPVSDAPHPRPSVRVTSQQVLPQNRRLEIKKQVEERRRMRFLTVNLGTMTEQRSCQHAKTEESLNRICARNQAERCKSQRNWRGL